jgi:uncharacterized protein DUF6221
VTDDLVAFLKARFDEDEQVGRAVVAVRPWLAVEEPDNPGWAIAHQASVLVDGKPILHINHEYATANEAEHIARWDPARVLAEVQAKRRIIDLHPADPPIDEPWSSVRTIWSCPTCSDADEGPQEWPCPTIRALALPYASCDGYRTEWAPS